MSFLSEALKGAKVDIDSAGAGLLPRLARTARVARVLGAELAAIVALAPYGATAVSVCRRLTALPPPPPLSPPIAPAAGAGKDTDPAAQSNAATAAAAAPRHELPLGKYGVAVHRQVSYGPAPRNVLDVYVPLRPPPSPSSPPPAAPPSTHPPNPSSQHQHPQQQRQSQPQPQPEDQAESRAVAPPPALPVVFFVHGGVWASGETWHYAPLATRLAQAGVVVVVPTYTLYPEALAGTMVEEVSAALSWTFDNAARYGGDPARITAAGHSAGGHLVAWALLRRAAAAEAAATAAGPAGAATAPIAAGGSDHFAAAAALPADPREDQRHRWEQYERERVRHQMDEQQPQGSAAHGGDGRDTAAYLLGGGGGSLPGAIHALRAVADVQLHPRPGVDLSYDDGSAAAAAGAAAAAPPHVEADGRMPALFVGMSAVYDIAKHYEFERSRAVHELSMMKRAVGGPAGFAAASPSVILARAADAAAAFSGSGGAAGSSAVVNSHYFTSFFTSFELLGDAIPSRAGLNGPDDGAADVTAGLAPSALPPSTPPFSLAAAARLPPFVVMGSCSDHMVPWHEGAELVLQLRRCGVPVRHLLYNHVGHGDFVMAWRPIDVRKAWPERTQAPEVTTARATATYTEAAAAATSAAAAADGGEPQLQLEGLLPCARDFVRIVTGRVQPCAPRLQPPRGPMLAPSSLSAQEGAAAVAAVSAHERLDGAVLVRSRL